MCATTAERAWTGVGVHQRAILRRLFADASREIASKSGETAKEHSLRVPRAIAAADRPASAGHTQLVCALSIAIISARCTELVHSQTSRDDVITCMNVHA